MFNTSTGEQNDDIGIVGTLNSLPRESRRILSRW